MKRAGFVFTMLALVFYVLAGNGDMRRSFINQPLDKKANRQNLVTRLQRVEDKTAAQPSAMIGNLSELSPDAGDQVAGTYYVVDQETGAIRGYLTATPNDQFPGYHLAFFDNAGVFQFGVSADDGSALAGAGVVRMDADGISVDVGDAEDPTKAYKFKSGDNVISGLWATYNEPGANTNKIKLGTPATIPTGLLGISAEVDVIAKTQGNAQTGYQRATTTIQSISNGGGGTAEIILDADPDQNISSIEINANMINILPQCPAIYGDEIITSVTGFARSAADTAQPYGFSSWATAVNCADGDEYFGSFVIDGLNGETYTLHQLGYTGNTYGKFDYYIDNVLVSSGLDWYSATLTANAEKTIASLTITAGRHVLKIKANGKNASSTDYVMRVTKIWFMPAAY